MGKSNIYCVVRVAKDLTVPFIIVDFQVRSQMMQSSPGACRTSSWCEFLDKEEVDWKVRKGSWVAVLGFAQHHFSGWRFEFVPITDTHTYFSILGMLSRYIWNFYICNQAARSLTGWAGRAHHVNIVWPGQAWLLASKPYGMARSHFHISD